VVKNDVISNKKKFLSIVPHGKTYHFINEKLIESNYMSDQFRGILPYNIIILYGSIPLALDYSITI